jgi:hypothetical protein
MTTTQRWTVAIIAVIAIGVALFAGGIALGRTGWAMPFGTGNMMGGYAPNQTSAAQMPYGNMMGYSQTYSGTVPYGMMGSNPNDAGATPYSMMNGLGMMGSGQPYSGTVPSGMMNSGYGGMLGGNMMGMMGNGVMSGNGMMGGPGSSQLYGVKPLSVDQAKKAVSDYVTRFNNPDLIVSEIVIFDNNAYARITEKSTGIGAFEVLVDPVTLAAYPEYGPNMMWNLKYGMMSGNGMMGYSQNYTGTVPNGMMGGGSMMGSGQPALQANGQMPVSADEAVQTAQRYLDTYLPGAKASAQPDPFYGYYTIEILRDGKTVGMLSVNGYTQQVFLHTWHGNFIEMSEG